MDKQGLSPLSLALTVILALLLIILFTKTPASDQSGDVDTYLRFVKDPLRDYCELNEACLWDSSRQVSLSNGMEGVCTSQGIACPSFSKDHSKALDAGLPPVVLGSLYQAIQKAEEELK